jgi:hypothetical protein
LTQILNSDVDQMWTTASAYVFLLVDPVVVRRPYTEPPNKGAFEDTAEVAGVTPHSFGVGDGVTDCVDRMEAALSAPFQRRIRRATPLLRARRVLYVDVPSCPLSGDDARRPYHTESRRVLEITFEGAL